MFLASKYCGATSCHSNGFSVRVKTRPDLYLGKITLVSARGGSRGGRID